MWKSDWKIDKQWMKGKEKWFILLACGFLLLSFSVPVKKEKPVELEREALEETKVWKEPDTLERYEQELEKRVQEILKQVDGVGKVDVMILLRSSGEKIVHVDQEKSRTSTEEKDNQGGSRSVMTEDLTENSVLNEEKLPFVEKELRPEVAGIIISAEGGGSAVVKAEISEAMEALFGLPAHKIKVLKRVE